MIFLKKKISNRNVSINFDELLNLDKKIRDIIQKKEKFEQEKKIISKTKDKSQFQHSKKISKEISDLEEMQKKFQRKLI